jgi:hypothetical protein
VGEAAREMRVGAWSVRASSGSSMRRQRSGGTSPRSRMIRRTRHPSRSWATPCGGRTTVAGATCSGNPSRSAPSPTRSSVFPRPDSVGLWADRPRRRLHIAHLIRADHGYQGA